MPLGDPSGTVPALRYGIVTPARDEAEFLHDLIQDVVAQTVRPVAWVIVDDGSADGTSTVVSESASVHSWMKLVRLPRDRGRLPGPGVVQAFNAGLAALQLGELDFVIKLDADVRLDRDFFGAIFREFSQRPYLGIAGGRCVEGRKIVEGGPSYHVRGATKVYRVACFRDIGGLQPLLAWDGIDEVAAISKGWETETIGGVYFQHRRPAGSHEDSGGRVRAAFREGRCSYIRGSMPVFVLLRIARLTLTPPVLLSGLAALAGYLSAPLAGVERVADSSVVSMQRELERERLFRRLDVPSLARRGRQRRG
jgi:biofilm PGA synthesis N-glycosyltransferase PgaC